MKRWLFLPLVLCIACGAEGPDDWDASDVPQERPTTDPYGGTFPDSATAEQIEALTEVNAIRADLGLAVVNQNEMLNEAAQLHADYLIANCERYYSSGLTPHEQNPDWPGFTGVHPWHRTEAAGYRGSGIGEVIAFVANPYRAVSGWMSTLYHRLPITDPTAVSIGYGIASGAEDCSWYILQNADVMNLGFKMPGQDYIVMYPRDQATRVPRAFDGYESPQPPIPPDGYPSGTIITVQFGHALPFSIQGHQLLEEEATPVDHLFLAPFADGQHDVMRDPHAQPTDNYIAMYAHRPLKANTTYRVVIDMVRGDEPLQLDWSFTTR